jgi:hypothetical protein
LQSHTQTHHNPIAVFTLNDHLPSQYALTDCQQVPVG